MSDPEKVERLARKMGAAIGGPGNTTTVKARPYAELLVEARDVIGQVQFAALGGRRCHLCAGWDVGPNGETDRVHTKTCPIRSLLSKLEAL